MRFRNVIRMSKEDWLKLLPDRIRNIYLLCVMLYVVITIMLLVLMILTGWQLWKAFLILLFTMSLGCFIVGICFTTIFFSLRIETEVTEEVIE